MREQLIRYLLGELDADERRDLQSRLKSSPELRAELEQLRSCFAANQDEDCLRRMRRLVWRRGRPDEW